MRPAAAAALVPLLVNRFAHASQVLRIAVGDD